MRIAVDCVSGFNFWEVGERGRKQLTLEAGSAPTAEVMAATSGVVVVCVRAREERRERTRALENMMISAV